MNLKNNKISIELGLILIILFHGWLNNVSYLSYCAYHDIIVTLEGIVSKSTLLCGDGRVCVHCHFDCNMQSNCRRDYGLGTGQYMLGVTVTMSTQSGDRHPLGSPWVAVFGVRVWVLGRGLQTGWRSWVAQCTSKGGHRMWVVVTRLGRLGTHVGCQWCPWAILIMVISSFFLSWVCHLLGCLLPNTYPIPPKWTGLCTNRKYCFTRNPRVGDNNICLNLHVEVLFVTIFASYLWV